MSGVVNAVCVQIRPKLGDKKYNFEKVKFLLEQNLSTSVDLIVLPEFFNTGIESNALINLAEPQDNNETLEFLSGLAKEYKSYLLAGSIMETRDGKLYNTSRLLDRNGEEVAKYDKIHLFDSFGGNEHTYCTAGDKVVVVDTDFGKVGLAVCFDIKFPSHYIELVKRGAEIIVEPAAWCSPKKFADYKKEEWILMNRARALDNMVYFVSANQVGKIDSFLSVYGHSMICAPNGEVLADAGEEECIISAQLNMSFLNDLRSQFNMKKYVE